MKTRIRKLIPKYPDLFSPQPPTCQKAIKNSTPLVLKYEKKNSTQRITFQMLLSNTVTQIKIVISTFLLTFSTFFNFVFFQNWFFKTCNPLFLIFCSQFKIFYFPIKTYLSLSKTFETLSKTLDQAGTKLDNSTNVSKFSMWKRHF